MDTTTPEVAAGSPPTGEKQAVENAREWCWECGDFTPCKHSESAR